MSLKQFSVLLLLASLFGASFLFIKIASPSLGPLFLIESRVAIAAISLIIFARLLKQKIEIKHKWKQLMILGTINAAIPFVLISYAELNLSASFAAIINSTTPLFAVIISILWLKEGKNMRTFFGIIMGCIGVSILVGWSPIQLNVKSMLSIGAISLAAFFYGIGMVYSKQSFQDMKSFDLAIGQQLGASIVVLPFALLDMPHKLPSISVTISVFALAILSTSLAYLLFFYLVKNIGPTKTASVTLLVPIFGIIWGVLFLDEQTTLSTYIGLMVVLMSIFLVSNTKQKVSNPSKEVVK